MNYFAKVSGSAQRSLPHWQLMKRSAVTCADSSGSLPHWQLMKCNPAPITDFDVFTAALAAYEKALALAHKANKFTAALAAYETTDCTNNQQAVVHCRTGSL